MISQYSIQTPTLLFPALSLLLLAYTNRFLGITQVIRKLHADLYSDPQNHDFYFNQIQSLSQRINFIVTAQKSGIFSMIMCVISMIFMLYDENWSFVCFCVALAALLLSLTSIYKELSLSRQALTYILDDCMKLKSKDK